MREKSLIELEIEKFRENRITEAANDDKVTLYALEDSRKRLHTKIRNLLQEIEFLKNEMDVYERIIILKKKSLTN